MKTLLPFIFIQSEDEYLSSQISQCFSAPPFLGACLPLAGVQNEFLAEAIHFFAKLSLNFHHIQAGLTCWSIQVKYKSLIKHEKRKV
ncbi:MAG: hypothetical protein ACKVQV_08665 [Bacteroidia bacterium]